MEPQTILSPPKAQRPRLLASAGGTRTEAFGRFEWGLLASIALIWGSSFVLIDVGLDSFRPGVIAAARVLLGAAALAVVPAARRPVDRRDLPRIAFLGVIWMGIPLSLFPIAQLWIDSSVAGMINGAMPLATAAWSILLLRRLPGLVQLAGLAVGFIGIVAISWDQVRGSTATLLGTLLVLGAVTLYGLSANVAVPLQQRYGSLPVLLRAQVAALAVVVPFGLTHLPGSSWSWRAAGAMVPLGALGTGLAFALMATLVGRVGGPRGSVAIYFVPVVAMALGVTVLDETISWSALAGAGLVMTGAWLTSRRERPSRAAGIREPAG
ncbi:MAG TPA: DMT family transporter [Actinomycetota bacterium]|nr:DMT family transporter [Actinomycetota bacterium]